VRPLPRYVLAIMAGFVVFELWIPLLAIILRALAGPTIPTAAQAVVPLFGLAVPIMVALGLSDYLADRRGLVRPYQPKRREAESDQDLADEQEDIDDEDESDWEEDEWGQDEDETGQEHSPGDDGGADEWREPETVEDRGVGARRPSDGQQPPGDPERPDRG
jgi:cobalamin biosynthesis protein CobT